MPRGYVTEDPLCPGCHSSSTLREACAAICLCMRKQADVIPCEGRVTKAAHLTAILLTKCRCHRTSSRSLPGALDVLALLELFALSALHNHASSHTHAWAHALASISLQLPETFT